MNFWVFSHLHMSKMKTIFKRLQKFLMTDKEKVPKNSKDYTESNFNFLYVIPFKIVLWQNNCDVCRKRCVGGVILSKISFVVVVMEKRIHQFVDCFWSTRIFPKYIAESEVLPNLLLCAIYILTSSGDVSKNKHLGFYNTGSCWF